MGKIGGSREGMRVESEKVEKGLRYQMLLTFCLHQIFLFLFLKKGDI